MSSTKGHVTVRKNSGADVGTEQRLNFIEGTNSVLTIADDPLNHEIDITVDLAPHAASHEPAGADEVNDIDILNTGVLLSAHAARHQNGGADEVNVAGLSGELADAQPVSVSKNSGAVVGTQPEINLIEGANITLTIVDDGPNNEVDITITGAGAGGGVSASQVMTVAAGNTASANWNHAQATSSISVVPLEEPESFWWIEVVDANNVIMHIATADLENNHTFQVLVF